MDKKESFYWDLVKGTAIFLMLWGHCIQYCSAGSVDCFADIAFKTIYTFHMPIFMLVSGYLFSYSFRKRNLTELLEHRIRGMLHPIIMATVFNNILMLIPGLVLSGHVNVLFGSLFSGISSDLWFLWAVLYCSLIVGIACKVTENCIMQALLLILGTLLILLFPQWNTTLFMYPYFVVGFLCGIYRKQAKRLYRMVRYVALILFPVMVAFYESRHYIYFTPMFSEELGLRASAEIALYRWAIGFVGSVWLLSVLEFLVHLGDRIPAVRSCLKMIAPLGRNSLQIYCLSASLLSGYLPHLYRKFVELVGDNLFARNMAVYDLLFTPVLTVFWSVFLYWCVKMLKKCRLHGVIFGR